MKKCRSALASLAAVSAALIVPSVSHAQVLLGTIEPGVGPLVGVAFDANVGNVFIYPDFSDAILEYQPDGTQVPPDITSPGASSNDYDMDFATAPVNLGGVVVGANTLLVVNGDNAPVTLFGIDRNDGTLLSSITLPGVASSVGGAFHEARGTFFNVSWTNDVISEINMTDGSVVNSFPVRPGGSPLFDVFFGDLDVDPVTGNLYVVSDNQNTIRELTPTGAFVRDIAVGGLGISGMSGIAYVGGSNSEAFISSTNGTVYYVGGLAAGTSAAPEPGAFALLATGLLAAGVVRRRRAG